MEAPAQLDGLRHYSRLLPGIPFDIACVGMRHQTEWEFLKVKKLSTKVLLVPDPGNIHDPRAVACYVTMPCPDSESEWTWIRAGYVAENQTHLIRDRTKVYEANLRYKQAQYWGLTVTAIREF